MTKKISKFIYKSEDCAGCALLAQPVTENSDEELLIICSLEQDGYEDNDDLDECPMIQVDLETKSGEGGVSGQASRSHGDARRGKMSAPIEETPSEEKKKKYAIRGNMLVEAASGELEMNAGFADAWNQEVLRLRTETETAKSNLDAAFASNVALAKDRLSEALSIGESLDGATVTGLFDPEVDEDGDDEDDEYEEDEEEEDENDESDEEDDKDY